MSTTPSVPPDGDTSTPAASDSGTPQAGRGALWDVGGHVCIVATAVLFAATVISLVIALTWDSSTANTLYRVSATTGILAVIVGIGWLLLTHYRGSPREEATPAGGGLYSEYQTGVGYAMLLMGAAMLLSLGGFAWMGQLERIVPIASAAQLTATAAPSSPQNVLLEHQITAIRLVISLGMAILGGLFFTASALRTKKQAKEGFDNRQFWSGLWYRLGEAVLFTVAFFLAFRIFGVSRGDLWLPLLGLMLGMFVKSGERLLSGIAQRVFAGVSAMVPVGSDDLSHAAGDKKPKRTIPSATGHNGQPVGSAAVVGPPDGGPVRS